MKKTFLFISAQYLPTTGGVERFTHALACNLIAQGHKVIVATSALCDLPNHETDANGIEIFRLPAIPFMNGRLPLVRPGRQFSVLSRELWKRKIDYCVINTYFYPLSMYAASQVYRRNIPALIINHGSAWLMTGNKILQLAGQLYEHIASRLCHHYCPRFFGVSPAARDWVKTFSIIPEGVITNAIDPDAVKNSADSNTDLRAELNLPQNAPVIAFVGRMIPEKGVLPLIDAVAVIRQVHPDACLLMAGNGPLYDQFCNSAPNGVYLLGAQPYEKVLALLQQANVFCLPSRSEGFACTVLEAAAMGCPIITTATGGSPDLLITPEYGILLKDMSAESISDACIQVLSDPQWQKEAAVRSYQRLVENFTWNSSLQQLCDAFHLQK